MSLILKRVRRAQVLLVRIQFQVPASDPVSTLGRTMAGSFSGSKPAALSNLGIGGV